MKKQYIIAFLLLVGLSVVTTMAFSTGSATTTIDTPLFITGDGAENITAVKVIPFKGDDGIMLKITLDSTAAEYDCYVQVYNSTGDGQLSTLDLANISGKLGSTVGSDTYDSDVEMIFFDLAGSGTEVIIKIEQTGIWTEASSITIVQDRIA